MKKYINLLAFFSKHTLNTLDETIHLCTNSVQYYRY